jgi:hypothetical protein
LAKINDSVYIVKTEDIIENTEQTMNGIADFLHIERNEILYRPTISGDSLCGKTLSLIGMVHDDPYKSLSKRQIKLLKYYFSGHKDNSFSQRIVLNAERFMIAMMNNRLLQYYISLMKRFIN